MKNFNFIFSIVFIFGFFSFVSCDRDVNFDLQENSDVFESVSLSVEVEATPNPFLNLKSTGASPLDSLEVLMYYEKNGSWIPVAKSNFADTLDIELEDFMNPFRVEYVPPIRIGHVLRANSRFVFRGLSDLGEDTYYGIVEMDLRNELGEEVPIVVPMVEAKSYFGMDVRELSVNDYRYVFDFSYSLSAVDYDRCATTIPPISGQVPDYYYDNAGAVVSRELVVEGNVVTLDGSIVVADSEGYIDVAEYFGSCDVDGVDVTVTAYDGVTEVFSSSMNKDWLEFGVNHYIQVANTTGGSFGFDLIDNEDVIEEWDWSVGELNLKDGLISWWNLANDAIDSHGSNDGIASGVTFDGSRAIFDGNDYVVLGNDLIEGRSEFTFSALVRPNSISGRYFIVSSDNGFNSNESSFSFRMWDSDVFYATVYDDVLTSFSVISTNSSLSTVGWNSVVIVFDGDYLVFYQNSVEVDRIESIGFGEVIHNVNNPLVLGRLGTYSAYYWNGDMSNIGIWNRALSSFEVAALGEKNYDEL